MIRYTDIAVIGHGPAGEAAAISAAATGAGVLLIGPATDGSVASLGGAEFARASDDQVERLAGTVLSVHRTDVGIDLIITTESGELMTCAALSAVFAMGARDLQLDFPGHDLGRVLTSRQALAARAELAGKRVVVAGAGQYVLTLGAQLASAGVSVVEVVTANSGGEVRTGLLGAGHWWLSGTRDRRILRECSVPVTFGEAIVAAQGNEDGDLTAVTLAPMDEEGHVIATRARMVDADVLVVSHGQLPNVDMLAELGMALEEDADDLPVAVCDGFGRTEVPAIMVAGDLAGATGVTGAAISGDLAGRAAAVPVFGMVTKVGKKRHLGALVRKAARLKRSSQSIAQAFPLITAEGVEAIQPPLLRMLPTSLGALAELDIPDRDATLELKETRLAEHFEIAAGEPALSTVIFDN